jgi:hypothetical protein
VRTVLLVDDRTALIEDIHSAIAEVANRNLAAERAGNDARLIS